MSRDFLQSCIANERSEIAMLELAIAQTGADLTVLCTAVADIPPNSILDLRGIVLTVPPIIVTPDTDRADLLRRLTDIYDTRRFRLVSQRDYAAERLAALESQIASSERSEVSNARRALKNLNPQEFSALVAEFA